MNKRRILTFVVLMVLIGILTYVLPQSIGLGAKGFDSSEVLRQFNFYTSFSIFFFLLFLGFIVSMIITRDDSKYGSSIGFADIGEFPAYSFFKRFTYIQLTMISIILFSILGLWAYSSAQTSFTSYITLEQAFSPTAQLTFSTLLIPGAENMGLAVVIMMTYIGLRMLGRKFDWSSSTYATMVWVAVPLISMAYWAINHLLRYSAQTTELFSVMLFGLVQGLLIVMTGVFIVPYILHQSNNFWFALKGLFASQTVFIYSITFIVIMIISYTIIYRGRWFGAKRNAQGGT